MQEMICEPGSRPDTNFFHIGDGFYYHKSESRGNTVVYFKCIKSDHRTRCKGRALYRRGFGFIHTKFHNHDPDLFYSDEMEMRRCCLERSRNLEYIPLKQIIEEEGERFPPEVQSRVTAPRMRTPMQKARAANFPPLPNSLQELTALLRDQRYSVMTMTSDGADNLYGGSVTAADGSHHVLLVTDRMLLFMAACALLLTDGTFKVVPAGLGLRRRSAQVMIVVTAWRHSTIPLAWVIMERRTQCAYVAVLGLLRARLTQLGTEISARKVISDYEPALMNSWEVVFQVEAQGCLYHVCKAFVTQAIKLGLMWYLRNDEGVRRLIRISCALPLLPSQKMTRGLVLLMREVNREGHIALMREYLQYLANDWILHRARRRRMCVYKAKRRTNNACESHNRLLKDRVGIHPNIFHFLRTLVSMENRAHKDIEGLNEGRRVGRSRRTSAVNNDERLRQLALDLEDPPDNNDEAIWRYLRRASRVMQNAFDEVAGDLVE